MELHKIIADFTPGAAGIWTLVAFAIIYGIREWRETRKLSAEDRLARRDGYAKQVEGLLVENRELRKEVADVNQRHEDYRKLCHAETDQLRDSVRHLTDEIQGYKRQVSDLWTRLTKMGVDLPEGNQQ